MVRASFGRAINRLVGRLGYEIRRKCAASPPPPATGTYRACLSTLLTCRERLRIVQVGANDGAINDPLHGFVRSAADRIDILLVEPQEYLIPYLRQNYAFHPGAKIFNGAIGPAGHLDLHAVDQAFWPALKEIPYAHDWPDYRAPTGVTSAERDQVLRWLRTHLRNPEDAERAVMRFRVPCLDLPDLLRQMAFPDTIDVLQIDAEGFDDQVIYHSAIGRLQPRIIHFEAHALAPDRYDALCAHLAAEGYEVTRQGIDALGLRTKRLA
jgi:FkbM family methyltransferase